MDIERITLILVDTCAFRDTNSDFPGISKQLLPAFFSTAKEKEVLLEKAAKGRQILVNSQFENQASVEKYTEEARKNYQD